MAVLPILGTSIEGVSRGGYVLEDIKGEGNGGDWYPTLTLLSSGTELALTLQAAQKMYEELQVVVGKRAWVRVVSMPCPQLFDTQSLSYKHSVLPGQTPIMSVEAAGVSSWYKYAHSPFGITTFGLSAPAPEIYKHMGFTVDNLAAHGMGLVRYFMKEGGYPVAPSLLDFPSFTTPPMHFH
ncbi:hypothetical protein EON63_15705 [archaeon]|nr:MAG: hypothetical protein EON63_15705 [archaeon]